MRTRLLLPRPAYVVPFMALACLSLPAIAPALAEEPIENSASWATDVVPAMPTEAPEPVPAEPQKTLSELRASLTGDDPLAVLEAVRYALDEVGDGATYVWRREEGPLWGMVRPVGTFRNAAGQVCRHIIVTLSLDEYTRQRDGDACRLEDDRWTLADGLDPAAALKP